MVSYVVEVPTHEMVNWGYSPDKINTTETGFNDLPSAVAFARKYIETPSEEIYGTIRIIKREDNISKEIVHSVFVTENRRNIRPQAEYFQAEYQKKVAELVKMSKEVSEDIDFQLISNLETLIYDLKHLIGRIETAKLEDQEFLKKKWW